MFELTKMKNDMGSKRILEVDLLRGLAVLLMVFAHFVAFSHLGEGTILHSIRWLGDTICFSIFLFVSGVSSYIAYIDVEKIKWQSKKKRLLKRLGFILIGYYIVAFISSIENLLILESSKFIYTLKILTFIESPDYTEFLVAFILFGLIIYFFKPVIKNCLSNSKLIILIPCIFYLIGSLMFYVEFTPNIVHFSAYLFGYKDLYRFPIFQYLPIFWAGLLCGQSFVQNVNRKIRKQYIIGGLLTSLGLLLFLYLFPKLLKFPYYEDFQRWPPSLSFILVGYISIFGLILFFSCFRHMIGEKCSKILRYFSFKAFHLYIIHIVFLEISSLFNVGKTDNQFLVIIYFLLSMLIWLFVVYLLGWRKSLGKNRI